MWFMNATTNLIVRIRTCPVVACNLQYHGFVCSLHKVVLDDSVNLRVELSISLIGWLFEDQVYLGCCLLCGGAENMMPHEE